MTVTATNRKNQFTTNGVTVNFVFDFAITDTSQVYALTELDGVETEYTDFTVVASESVEGGTLTTSSALDGVDLLIYRDVSLTQQVDYESGGKFPADAHEQALDKLTLQNQDQQDELDRSLKSDISEENPPTLSELNESIDERDAQTLIKSKEYTNQQVIEAGTVTPLIAVAISINTDAINVTYDTAGETVASYIYSDDQQKTYSVPTAAIGKIIVSVVGSALNTTIDGPYQLESINRSDLKMTLSQAIDDSSLLVGDSVRITDRDNQLFNVVLTSSVTPTGFAVVESVAVPLFSLELIDNTNLNARGLKNDGLTGNNADVWDDAMSESYVTFEVAQTGTYWFERQIVGKSFLTIKSPWVQGLLSQTVTFKSDTATIGDGQAILKLAEDPNQIQTVSIQNISFRGDTDADSTDLSTVPDAGIVAIDIDGVKDGLQITGCAGRNLRGAIWRIDNHGYVGHADFTNNSWRLMRQPFKGINPTTGTDISGTKVYDCYTIGDIARPYGKNVTFNNSSASDDYAGLVFDVGHFTNLYIEGFNRTLQPSRYLKIDGASYLSESFEITGSKYSISPQSDDVLLDIEGTRIATNTRLINFSDITDNSTLTVELKANYNGVNFGNVSSILTYIQAGVAINGVSNEQSDWNTKATNTPTYSRTNLEVGEEKRIPVLRDSHHWTDSISFDLNFSDDYQEDPASSLSYSLAEFSIVGTDNGAGGTNAFFAKLYVYNGYNTTWDYHLGGADAASYTVAITNTASRSCTVTITEVHGGSGEILMVDGATANGKITLA